MPKITALRDDGRGRVAVELDGAVWRTLPVDVVVRAELREGRTLDRPALRLLRRELRRTEALGVAGRALRARDLSRRQLAARLERAAVDPSTATESLDTLAGVGLLDDGRFAHNRAERLAGRGFGDAAIRHDLERQGVPTDLVEGAMEALEPEGDRAKRIVARRGSGARTARYLASKGFGEEAVEAAAAANFANDP